MYLSSYFHIFTEEININRNTRQYTVASIYDQKYVLQLVCISLRLFRWNKDRLKNFFCVSPSPMFILEHIFLAAKPGITSVCSGNEGNLLSHFHVIYAPATLIVFPLSLSAGLLKVAFALHCVNNPILSQNPGEHKICEWTWEKNSQKSYLDLNTACYF